MTLPTEKRTRASTPAQPQSVRRRLPRGARRGRILEVAAEFFAERGLDAPTRELASRLGVTQALLYRYFPSKGELIQRVFDWVFGTLRERSAGPSLDDRTRPLEERLTAMYQEYLARVSYTSMRLFVQAGLHGGDLARRFSVPLSERVLRPIIEELRYEAGLPGPEVRPLMRGERELAMTLHGGIMFLAVRKFVYGMPMPDELSDLVALQVRTFLPGAVREVRRLHGDAAEPTLTIRQLDRRPRS
ncbi:MAG: helix-turn-helix domain-containing protein [Geminicoccaceae bacterium]